VSLAGLAVSDFAGLQPWSKRSIFKENARDVEGVLVYNAHLAKMRTQK